MTNIVAALIITTNSHWSVIRTEPSGISCAVIGCARDHSEQRTERETVYRVSQAEFVFEGATNRVTLKSEVISQGRERILRSGFDYVKEKSPFFYASPITNWWVSPL